MRVRDSFARINGDDSVIEFPSGGIEIIGEDGRTLFGIDLKEGRILRVDSGNVCKHEGAMLDDRFVIAPIASNAVNIIKTEYISK